jgi:hypothetical protein
MRGLLVWFASLFCSCLCKGAVCRRMSVAVHISRLWLLCKLWLFVLAVVNRSEQVWARLRFFKLLSM